MLMKSVDGIEVAMSPEEESAIRAEWAENDAAVHVPRSVTMRQARLALLGAGLLSQVDATIAALPSPQKEAALIEWNHSQDVLRDNSLVKILGPAINLTEAQIDQLFITAATL